MGVHGRAAAAAARISLTVYVRAWWCVCAVGFVVGGGAVFVLLLCGLCWRGGRAGGWWRLAGVSGGGHVSARVVWWCVARDAAASWAVSLVRRLRWGVAVWRRRRGAGVACNIISLYVEWRGMALVARSLYRSGLRSGGRASGVRAWSGEWR